MIPYIFPKHQRTLCAPNVLKYYLTTTWNIWAVVVSQLAKWLLPTPEVQGSNPIIGKVFIAHY